MAVLKDHSIEISGRGAEIENEWVEQAECRICQEEEQKINLEVPCGCSGTAKYAHRKCVQRWCNEKGNTVCEICHQPYRSGYTANPRHGECDRTGLIHLRDQWAVGEELQEFAEERFWGLDDEDYSAINSATAASCRSAAIILLPLLLIRHVIAVAAVANAEEYSSLLSISCWVFAPLLYIGQSDDHIAKENASPELGSHEGSTRWFEKQQKRPDKRDFNAFAFEAMRLQ